METKPAAPCRVCRTTAGSFVGNTSRPWRGRGLCHRCYNRLYYHGPAALAPYPRDGGGGWHGPTTPTGIVTPAMLGIRPGQPPTDPGCTPTKVWEIANRNARRVLLWLATHPEHATEALYDALVWTPAVPEEHRAAA